MLTEDEILTLFNERDHEHKGIEDDHLRSLIFDTLKSFYKNNPKDLKYEYKIHFFIEFSPPAKYYSLLYKEVAFENVGISNCTEDQIMNIKGKFYVYTGVKSFQSNEKKPEIIRFLDKARTPIAELLIVDDIKSDCAD